MSDLPSSVIAELKATQLVAAVLVEMDFPSGVVRVWNGAGELETLDERTWQGVGEFGAISEMESATALESAGFTLEMRDFGAADLADEAAFITAFKAAVDEAVFGRDVRIYLQVFDVATMALVNDPQAVVAARMVHTEADWQSIETAVARAQCEHVLAWSRMTPAAYLTDADQQARNAGDLACRFTTILPTREVTWPRD